MNNYDQFVHAALEAEDEQYLDAMKEFIKRLKEEGDADEARAALIRTGVLNEDGSRKESICALGMTI